MLGPSKEIFDPHFFSSFEPAWATDQWVKIVSILVKISQSYSNFLNDTALSQSPRSIILRGVTHDPGKSTTISEIFCTGL